MQLDSVVLLLLAVPSTLFAQAQAKQTKRKPQPRLKPTWRTMPMPTIASASVRFLPGEIRQAHAGRAAHPRRRLAWRRQKWLWNGRNQTVSRRGNFRSSDQLSVHRAGDGAARRAARKGVPV